MFCPGNITSSIFERKNRIKCRRLLLLVYFIQNIFDFGHGGASLQQVLLLSPELSSSGSCRSKKFLIWPCKLSVEFQYFLSTHQYLCCCYHPYAFLVETFSQLSGFVAALRLFFVYGLTSRPQLTSVAVGHNEQDLVSLNFTSQEPKKKDNIPYRPPHLRKKDSLSIKQPKAQNYQVFSDHESSTVDFTSSDSEYSDSDGSLKDTDNVRSSKVRVAAIVCLQVSSQHHFLSYFDQLSYVLIIQCFVRIS